MRPTNRRLKVVNARYKEHKLSRDDLRRVKAVKKLLPSDISIMIDIGCFDGTITNILRPNREVTVIGLELLEEASRRAKGRVDEVILCDIEESLPLRDDCADCVYAGEIIEHLFDPDYFVEEGRRILKQNGCLIITTPNLAGLGSRLSLLLGRKPWMIEERLREEYAGHIRHFTVSTLEDTMRDHGLAVNRVTSDGIKLGRIVSKRLRQVMPRLGLHIIVRAKKE